MKFDELNESNYLLFAIKFYNNPQSVTREDFEDDLKRIKYIKRLLKRYKNTGELKIHLILNHLTVLFNVFDEAAVPLLLRVHISGASAVSLCCSILICELCAPSPVMCSVTSGLV